MKCPYCEGEMKNGGVIISGPSFFRISWFPEEERKKLFKSGMVSLKNPVEGYRCNNCEKVIALFNEK